MKNTVEQLAARADEVYNVAETKPLDALLQDLALARQLYNPLMLKIMTEMCGEEGAKLVHLLQTMDSKN